MRNRKASLWRALASVLTGTLIASAALVGVAAPASAADGYALSASSTVTPNDKVTVSTAGSGFAEIPLLPGQQQRSLYIALIVKGSPLSAIGQGGAVPNAAVDVAADGTFTGSLEQTAADLDRTASYEVIAWPSRSNPTDANLYARTDVAIDWATLFPATATSTSLTASPSGTALVGSSVALSATVSPDAAGSVEFFDGAASLGSASLAAGIAGTSTSALSVGAHNFTAVFTPADSTLFTGSTSAVVAFEVTADEPEPEPEPLPVPAVVVSQTSGLDAAGESVAVTGSGFVPNAPATDGTRRPLQGVFGGTYVQFGYYVGETWTAGRTADVTKWAVHETNLATVGGADAGGIVLAADGTFSTSLLASEVQTAPDGARFGIRTFAGSGSTYAAFSTFTEVTFAEPVPTPTLSVTPSSELDADGATITITGENYSTAGKAIYGPSAGQPAGVYAQIGWLAPDWRPSLSAPSTARTNAYSAWVQGVNTTAPYLKWTDNGDGTADFVWTVTIDQATLDAKKLERGTLSVFTVGAGGVVQAANELSQAITFAEEVAVPVPTVTVTPSTDLDPNVENVLTVSGSNFTGPGAASGAYVLFGANSIWSGGSALPGEGWIDQGWVMPNQIVNGSFTTTLTIPAGTIEPGTSYQVATSAAHGLSVTDRSLDTFTPVTVADVALEPSILLGSGSVRPGDVLEVRGAGFTAGDLATVTVNSDPITLGTATVAEDGTFTVSGTIPLSFAAGTHTVTASVNGVPIASQSLIVTALPVVAAVETPAEPTCVAQAVSGASLEWGVKQSFRDYINGPIAKGSISGGWGSGSGAYNTADDRGRVAYSGAMTFTGHSGALDITISNPRIQITSASSASLIVDVSSKGYNGSADVNAYGIVFATLSLPSASESGSRISWSGAAATLTAAGAEAFAGFYGAGTSLDSVSFSFPLGAEVPCDVTTSNALAATGGDAPIDTVWLGLGMLVLGAGVFALRRRSMRV